MRSFKQYIVESLQTYNYTIKIAGEIDKNWLDLFKFNLKKFDPLKISDPVSTPIQKSPYGFPGLSNQPITTIKAEFKYPATEPMIQQIAQLLGYNINMIRVVQTNYDDSVNKETEMYANQAKDNPLLTKPQLEDNGKEASKEYGQSYLNSIKKQAKGEEITIPYEGKETKDQFDPFKPYMVDSKGQKSPMTNITLPAKPPTGAKK